MQYAEWQPEGKLHLHVYTFPDVEYAAPASQVEAFCWSILSNVENFARSQSNVLFRYCNFGCHKQHGYQQQKLTLLEDSAHCPSITTSLSCSNN